MLDYDHSVTLGPLESRYLEQMCAWRNDPTVWKWCRQNDLISDVAQAKWFSRIQDDATIKMYLIHAKASGDVVGVCGLTSIDWVNRRAEFSLYIAPKAQRKGYARAALATLLSHGFLNLGLNSIWGETFDGNPAADLFESLGFEPEGTRRSFYFRDGQFIDAHLYSMLACEWLGAHHGRSGNRASVYPSPRYNSFVEGPVYIDPSSPGFLSRDASEPLRPDQAS